MADSFVMLAPAQTTYGRQAALKYTLYCNCTFCTCYNKRLQFSKIKIYDTNPQQILASSSTAHQSIQDEVFV
jgi:hypothetical protein